MGRGQEPSTYQIEVQGKVDRSWSQWFEGMGISFGRAADGAPITTLTGVVADQAALRGILTRIWDLNLTVVALNRIEQGGRRDA